MLHRTHCLGMVQCWALFCFTGRIMNPPWGAPTQSIVVRCKISCGRGLYHRVNSDSPGALRQRSTSVDRLWLVKGRRRPSVGQRPIETDFSRSVGPAVAFSPQSRLDLVLVIRILSITRPFRCKPSSCRHNYAIITYHTSPRYFSTMLYYAQVTPITYPTYHIPERPGAVAARPFPAFWAIHGVAPSLWSTTLSIGWRT